MLRFGAYFGEFSIVIRSLNRFAQNRIIPDFDGFIF